MICPFCEYKRKNEDINPEWQCPSCNKAYKKFHKLDKNEIKYEAVYEEDDIEDSPIQTFLLICLFTPVVFYNIKDLLYDGVVSVCSRYGGSCSYINFDESPIAFCVFLIFTLALFYFFCRIIIDLFRRLIT
jgi:hypothetical protein